MVSRISGRRVGSLRLDIEREASPYQTRPTAAPASINAPTGLAKSDLFARTGANMSEIHPDVGSGS